MFKDYNLSRYYQRKHREKYKNLTDADKARTSQTLLSNEDWMADFAFAVDVTALMTELNTKLQGKGLFVDEMHSLVKALMRKIQFLSRQLESNTLPHMQALKEVSPSADHLCRYSTVLGALHGEFEELRTMEDEMHMISSPFICSVQ